MSGGQAVYNKIILPVRPQPDTIVAIFILKIFGSKQFSGIENARVEIWPIVPKEKSAEEFENEGHILIDTGGGRFDHHNKEHQITASQLVVDFLEINDDPTLTKLLEYAKRDDFFGKGTISSDPIDRAFGLSALIAALNKSYPDNPNFVVNTILPIIAAHYNEEKRRFEEFPNELEQKKLEGKVVEFAAKQRDKKLKIIMIESDNIGMPGYLRSQIGGRFDVVVQRREAGFVNILTRPTKRIDLRSLVALIRVREAEHAGIGLSSKLFDLIQSGRISEVNNWYYDTATNSILNGGSTPTPDIEPTKISWDELAQVVDLGLSEKFFDPRHV
ncbi:MAG: hypothetical protein ABR875_00555 [Minisyncoccia bacterium]